MNKKTKTQMQIPRKLFLLNVEDFDAVSRLFNGSICYKLTWEDVFKARSSGSRLANSPTSDEQLLLACHYFLQLMNGLPKKQIRRLDIVLVLNPARKYLDVREVFLTYSTAVFIRGTQHMKRLYDLEKRLSANELFELQINEIKAALGTSANLRYAPLLNRFTADILKTKKLILSEFSKWFVI